MYITNTHIYTYIHTYIYVPCAEPIPRFKRAGIGVTFLQADGKGGIVVKRVKPGGPCEGVLNAGDRVLAFDGESNEWFTNKDVARLTMGMLDTEVCIVRECVYIYVICVCVCMCVYIYMTCAIYDVSIFHE